MLEQISIRKIVLFLSLVYLLFLFVLINGYNNTGKIKVNIQAIPEDSQIFIDNQEVNAGNESLYPGEYTFKATKEGYEEDSYTVFLDEDSDVRLLPEPTSDSAITESFTEENQAAREAYGGIRANLIGQDVRNENSIIEDLPINRFNYLGNKGPFSIDYGFRENGQLYLLISNSSPNGRVNAVNWLRDKNYVTSEYDIEFDDFQSPFKGEQ